MMCDGSKPPVWNPGGKSGVQQFLEGSSTNKINEEQKRCAHSAWIWGFKVFLEKCMHLGVTGRLRD